MPLNYEKIPKNEPWPHPKAITHLASGSLFIHCGTWGRVCHDAGGAELSRADISLRDISINSGQQESLPYLIQASSLFK